MNNPRIAIVGAGPAGMAASIQLKRLGYSPFLFEKESAGGLLWNANLVENYPGFPKGISGPELISLMISHLNELNIKIIQLEINRISQIKGCFKLKSGAEEFTADYIIVASGTKPKPLKLEISDSIRRLIHNDLRKLQDVKGKHIVIIGSGEAAFDQALNLSSKNLITIINRGEEIKALKLLAERSTKIKKISYMENTQIEKMELLKGMDPDANRIIQIVTRDKTGETHVLECEEVISAVGREAQLEFLDHHIESEKIFLVGDVKNGLYRQVGIAIGDGILAAMKIHNKILKRK
jgi:thioredoxin reductase (NADPH)